MSRDERFPGHRLFRKVSTSTQTPVAATLLPLAIGVVTMLVLPGDALLELITAGTLFPAITYGLIVLLYLAVRRRLGTTEGAFSLGRFEVPVAVIALIWTVAAVIVLISPPGTGTSIVIVAGLIVIGAVYLAVMVVTRPSVLPAQPTETTPL